ncbi:uncharacterized protein LOC116775789 isoform X2 [Danaus plexippus]|uniref:uncharacterized protein LOC116775789 isoform X2 n=1 Tax=Danaus plexippus TaxID=13037 RepID=UPI002AB25194|nr:uncharacterized protein LOC116775789 isoform X2 [Danaus plexippus]
MWSVLTLTLCVFISLSYNTKDSPGDDQVNDLVRNLRKQLMKGNQDYTLKYNEIQNIQMRSNTNQNRDPNENKLNKTLNFTKTERGYVRGVRSEYIKDKISAAPRKLIDESINSYEGSENTYSKRLEHPVHVKDLLYYMDEEKILKDKLGPETRNMAFRRSMVGDDVGKNKTEKKYKVLKVRNQFRRKEPRRLIQEEGGEGIVVMALDGEPLPEFRLPKSRRQYKHERGVEDTDEEELSPPTVHSEEDVLTT